VSWISGDTATEYLAWSFLREESGLSIPLGWSSAIGYPLGISIAYMDPMPLLATIGRVVSDALPHDFQYFGPYFVLCLVLQFYFGFRIARQIFGGDRLAGWLGGGFFMIAPAFIWRSIGHFSLIGQWVILAALDQLLHATLQQAWPRVIWSGTLCLTAAAINPYIAAMTLLVCCAAHLQPLLFKRGGLPRAFLGIATAVCSTVSGLVLFGFMTTLEASQYVGGGYGLHSMNLVAPIDPGRPGALLLKTWPITPEQQMEGYNYLGLGLLLLGAIAVCRRPVVLGYIFRRSSASVLGVFGVSLLLALSTQALIGPYSLYKLHLPGPIMTVLTSFRASGRLFWPGYYLIFAGILFTASVGFRGRWLHVTLGVALTIQILDLMPLRSMIHERWKISLAPQVPTDPSWHVLGQTQKHLVVLPAWQCAAPVEYTPGGATGYAIFGKLALEQQMTINSFYASRYSAEQHAFFCTEQVKDIQQHGLQDDTAYVFTRDKAAWVAGIPHGDRFCRYVEDYILCSSVSDRAGADAAILQDVVVLKKGSNFSFTEGNPIRRKLLGLGWSPPESWGNWSDGPASSITFAVEGNEDRDLPVRLLIRAFVPPAHPVQRVIVTANGIRVADQEIRQADPLTLSFVIPAASIGSNRLVRLDFWCPNAVSPAAMGLSFDFRELSIGVVQMRVGDAGD
jgi:hypothetical protein